MPDVLAAVRANTSNGGRIIFPVSEDIFIYGASAPFYVPNPNHLLNFYGSIAEEPGVDYLPLSHATIAPSVVNPGLIRDLSKVLLQKSALQNRNSRHPGKRFLAPPIGIETGSPHLAALTMSGKSLPFDIRDWQEIVVEGTNILNDNNWFPVCTFIVGLPNETDDDIKLSLALFHCLKNNKVLYVPSIFTPLEDTRMASGHAMKARELTRLQWEFIMTSVDAEPRLRGDARAVDGSISRSGPRSSTTYAGSTCMVRHSSGLPCGSRASRRRSSRSTCISTGILSLMTRPSHLD